MQALRGVRANDEKTRYPHNCDLKGLHAKITLVLLWLVNSAPLANLFA